MDTDRCPWRMPFVSTSVIVMVREQNKMSPERGDKDKGIRGVYRPGKQVREVTVAFSSSNDCHA